MSGRRLAASLDERVRLETEDIGRDIGIPAIGKAPWGTHVCQFYDTDQDLLDIILPYFRIGLDHDEQCVWVACEPLGSDEMAEALSREVDDFDRRLAQGQIALVPYSSWFGGGTLDEKKRERLLEPLIPQIRRAQAYGYTGIRAAGNLSWVGGRLWGEYMAYEGSLDRAMAGQNWIGLRVYPLANCDSSRMLDVLRQHQFALIKLQGWTLIEPSERKRATAAVERMNQALAERTALLQEALADLRGFSRWVTHDLRAPLRSITTFGELLTESCESKLDDDERHMLGRIRQSADRMGELISDILAYSIAQQADRQVRSLDLEELAREVWPTLTEAMGGRRIHLQLRPMPRVYGDRTMLRQVLANLLGNAVKFTGTKPDGYVEVGTLTVDGECVYYVRDNGIGFDQSDADRLFGAFERLHARSKFEGSGLGLTIVKQIITRHGGRVWAEGSPGVGATVYFTLPEPRPAVSGC